MPMNGSLHSRTHDGFHVLCDVFCICAYREWTDFRNPLTALRTPSGLGDRHQPNLSKRLKNGSRPLFGLLGQGSGREFVQMPESWLRRHLRHRLARENPTSNFAGPLANR
jgi:hypothetical protein